MRCRLTIVFIALFLVPIFSCMARLVSIFKSFISGTGSSRERRGPLEVCRTGPGNPFFCKA